MSDEVFKSLPPEAAELGAPLAHLPNRPWRCLTISGGSLVLMIVGTLIAVFTALYCLINAIDGWRSDFLLCGLFLAALAILSLVGVGRAVWPVLESSRVRGVVTFPDGIVLLTDGGAVPVPWDAISEVRNTARVLHVRDGKAVQLPPSLDDWPLLADLILRSTYRPLTLRAEVALASEGAAAFGLVSVRSEGIVFAGTLLPWGAVGSGGLGQGTLWLARRGASRPLFRVPLSAVPNWHVLWGMIERRAAGDGASPAPATAEPETWILAAESGRSLPSVRPTIPAPVETRESPPAAPSPRPEPSPQPLTPREYAGNPPHTAALLWVAGGAVVLAPLLLAVGFVLARRATDRDGESRARIVFKFGGALLVVGVMTGAATAFARSLRVRVSPEGVSHRTAWCGTSCRWEEIEEQRWEVLSNREQRRSPQATRLYHLICKGGRRITLDDRIGDFDALVKQVQGETARRQLPALLDRLRSGELLHFGPFAVTTAGIVCGGLALDWEDVMGADCEGGRVSFGRRGSWVGWGNVPVTQVPNSHLLLALAREVVRA